MSLIPCNLHCFVVLVSRRGLLMVSLKRAEGNTWVKIIPLCVNPFKILVSTEDEHQPHGDDYGGEDVSKRAFLFLRTDVDQKPGADECA